MKASFNPPLGLSLFISSTETMPRNVRKEVQYVVFTHFLRGPYDDVKFIKSSFETGAIIKMKDSFQGEVYRQPNERNSTAFKHDRSNLVTSLRFSPS